MSARLPGAHNWAASLVLHGLLVAGVFVLIRPHPAPMPPMSWEVSLVTPVPEASAPLPPEVRPPAETRAKPETKVESKVEAKVERKVASDERPAPAPPAPSRPDKADPAPRAEPAGEAVRQATPVLSPPDILAAVPTIHPRTAPSVVATGPVAAPADKPVAVPAPAPPDIDTRRRWQALLAAKLRELKRYPSLSRRLGEEGVVVLEAHFLADGRAAANVKQSSGHAALDRAAVKLFEDAAAALTGQWAPHGDSLLEIPVAYRLES